MQVSVSSWNFIGEMTGAWSDTRVFKGRWNFENADPAAADA
ncbi:hypothetical protein FACS189475_09350 [Betaproteobacteria bacterium]|nr:hypothetical protein FACS189475_09350 [Betaproteobacteria bacterium]